MERAEPQSCTMPAPPMMLPGLYRSDVPAGVGVERQGLALACTLTLCTSAIAPLVPRARHAQPQQASSQGRSSMWLPQADEAAGVA